MDARALPAPTTQNNPLASAVKPLQPIQPVGTAESRRTGNTDADGTAANAGPLRQVEALLSRSAAAEGNLTFETGEIIGTFLGPNAMEGQVDFLIVAGIPWTAEFIDDDTLEGFFEGSAIVLGMSATWAGGFTAER